MPSSNSLSNCRIDWRGSRLLPASLALLGLLAGVSLALSDLPWLVALPASLIAFGHGLWLARREWRREPFVLVWALAGADVLMEYRHRQVHWSHSRAVFRGWLVSVSGIDREGRGRQLNAWPDSLSDDSRRRLRLAAHRTRSA